MEEKTIEQKIEELSIEERDILKKNLVDSLYDRMWCSLNGIDYCNPNIHLAREKIYNELYR